jgi:hypothetical protein
VDGRVVSSDVVRGDLRSPRTMSLDTTQVLSTAHQLEHLSEALGTLPEDGNVTSKHAGATIHD